MSDPHSQQLADLDMLLANGEVSQSEFDLRKARIIAAATQPPAAPAATRRGGPGLGIALAVIGVVLGIIGAVVMNVASGRRQRAQDILGYSNAFSGRHDTTSPAIDAAISMGHVGLGFLIFGGALLLCGILIAALRRR